MKHPIYNLLKLSVFCVITLSACQKDQAVIESEEVTNFQITGNERASNAEAFNEEVVFFFETKKYQMKSDSLLMPLQLTIRNTDGNIPTNEGFVVNGIPLVDNGKGNDRIANDGIYTAIRSSYFHKEIIEMYEEDEVLAFTSPDFQGDLNYITQGLFVEFTITCDVTIVDCPNEEWYNTSLFGEPCVEFSNCEITFTMGLES